MEAKKNLANFSVVLDTPEYKRVTELKTHLSNVSLQAHFVRLQYLSDNLQNSPRKFVFDQLLNSLILCFFFFQLIYKAHSKVEMSKATTPADTVDLKRAKWAQQLTNKASLERCNVFTVVFH